MHLIVEADATSVATRAADWMAAAIADDIAERGRAIVALSGGRTPWRTFAELAKRKLPWESTHLAQVDERVVPADDDRRNAKLMQKIFVAEGAVLDEHLHTMPVDVAESELDNAAGRYGERLALLCGGRLWLDLVQLGLGDDGHTASLVPNDPVLDERERDVVVTREYFGTRRMTLTYPAINRARRILWLITGSSKSAVLTALLAQGGTTDDYAAMPSLGISRERATVIADAAAAQDLPADFTA
ncbi:MAG TPA: 6-phosphogluconolactonase [Steroidobacteraceae bacterium]|nr:6-phosphogluconolactonase [Steroidobacteraceae bacterium]HRX88567.1 6-phosphogluconolactonase [Steroidobacteraceae bacterium]